MKIIEKISIIVNPLAYEYKDSTTLLQVDKVKGVSLFLLDKK